MQIRFLVTKRALRSLNCLEMRKIEENWTNSILLEFLAIENLVSFKFAPPSRDQKWVEPERKSLPVEVNHSKLGPTSITSTILLLTQT